MVRTTRINPQCTFPDGRTWLAVIVIVVVVVSATPWVGEAVVTAALGVLAAAIPVAGRLRAE
ncbi:hypothetical protein F4556_005048 [Kitasatospora gansuensis]|uniref:Uncharacterized protein n=1 Tax=Kitasatospora gansuensis TaxID=258050 RepID=A0A7W7WJT9_9ACTN|nr:hypothetical protein [Kitasatospora gansuensis]MBB4949513.1 hypothetical protein [Kitasatospora gansuensis]